MRLEAITRRIRLAVGAVAAAVLGVAPHVRHHVGPLAALALFAALFTVSTTLVGPAISGDGGDDSPAREAPAAPSRDGAPHEEHHE